MTFLRESDDFDFNSFVYELPSEDEKEQPALDSVPPVSVKEPEPLELAEPIEPAVEPSSVAKPKTKKPAETEEVSENLRSDVLKNIKGNNFKSLEYYLDSKIANNERLTTKMPNEYNLMYYTISRTTAKKYKLSYEDSQVKTICEKLLELGEDLDTAGEWGITPVFQAAKSGLKLTFDFLVSKGAIIDKVVVTNIAEGSVPFSVSILDYAKTSRSPNKAIIKELESKGIKSVAGQQSSNVSTNDKQMKLALNAAKNYSNLPKMGSIKSTDEALAIVDNLIKTIDTLSNDMKNFLLSVIKVTSPEQSKEFSSMMELRNILKKRWIRESISGNTVIKDPSIYTLMEDYEDTPYSNLVSLAVADIVKEPMPKQEGKTIEKYIVANLSNPSSPFLPTNTERLDTLTDFLAAVVYKIFMIAQNAEELFSDLHEEIMEVYGPTTSKGGSRKITGTIYSAAFSAADFLEKNLFSKDAALKQTVEEIYSDIKHKVSETFSQTGPKEKK